MEKELLLTLKRKEKEIHIRDKNIIFINNPITLYNELFVARLTPQGVKHYN